MDSFFPVVDTEIGKIGTLECMDTSYPETARGMAMNGAEILYAPTYIEPYVGRGWHEIQLRARALDNNCYVVSPNSGNWFLGPDSKVPTDMHGGNSMIIDYTGQVLARHAGDGNSFVSAPIDIEALRYWRTKVSFGAWIKDLRTEQFQLLYKEPIMPKNRFMAKPPGPRKERMQVELAKMGVKMNYVAAQISPAFYCISPKEVAANMRAVGVQNTLISTDVGQTSNPDPIESMRSYVQILLNEGFTPCRSKDHAPGQPCSLSL